MADCVTPSTDRPTSTNLEHAVTRVLLRYKRRLYTALSCCDRDATDCQEDASDTFLWEKETAQEILALLDH